MHSQVQPGAGGGALQADGHRPDGGALLEDGDELGDPGQRLADEHAADADQVALAGGVGRGHADPDRAADQLVGDGGAVLRVGDPAQVARPGGNR